MQLGLNLLSSMPWLLPFVLILIALHQRWTHLKALELRHGLLDTEAFLATGTLLHPDPSWSLWIIPLYKNWRIAANLIMPYTVLLPVQISETSVLENSKLFSPRHVYLNQSKQAFSLFEIFAPHWQLDYAPNGTSIWYLLIWNFATVTLKVMFSKYHLIWPSCSFWRNTDLNGASGNTITLNLPCLYLVLHSLSYCDFVAIESAKVSSYHNFIRSQRKKIRSDWALWQCDSFTFTVGFWMKTCDLVQLSPSSFMTSVTLALRLFIYLYMPCSWTLIGPYCPLSFRFSPSLSWSFHPWKTNATHR